MARREGVLLSSGSLFVAVLAVFYVFSDLRYGTAREGGEDMSLVFEVRERIHSDYVDQVDSLRVIDAGIDGMLDVLSEDDALSLEQDWEADRPGDSAQRQRLIEAFKLLELSLGETVSPDSLVRGSIWGMLAALDPHSSYLGPSDYEDMVERFRGDFEGIGIYFEVRDGRLLVIAPIFGSPSHGKLRAGDHIAEIEGISTLGISDEEVMDKLRGARGSLVRVGVARQGREGLLHYEIRRDRVTIRSVPYAYMLTPDVGYVRMVRFGETTADELDEALNALRDQGMRSLVLDLRDNGGGLLDQAVEVADFFLDAGQLIVYTEGREGNREEYRARKGLGAPLPLVVLINRGSASASEIVAGAVQDLDMGLVAGETSFGKGLVQGQFPLRRNGGLLLLTVARYYTPLGRLIQRPYTDDVHAYYEEGIKGVDPNSVDSLHVGKSVFYTALGRRVYGGGGITPDVMLPAEEYSEFTVELLSQGYLADFCGYWVGMHSDWPAAFSDYLSGYEVDGKTVQAWEDFVLDKMPTTGDSTLAVHRTFVRDQLKAGFARVLWGEEEYYRVYLQTDKQLEAALVHMAEAAELVARRY